MIIQATGLSFLRRSFFICEKGIEPYLQGGEEKMECGIVNTNALKLALLFQQL